MTESQGHILSNWHLSFIPLFPSKGEMNVKYTTVTAAVCWALLGKTGEITSFTSGIFPQMQTVKHQCLYHFPHVIVMKKNRDELKLPQCVF